MSTRCRPSRRQSPTTAPTTYRKYLTDRWLADNTLFGPPAKVQDGIEAWRAAGVNTPVLVPNSLIGNQLTALQEIFNAFAA